MTLAPPSPGPSLTAVPGPSPTAVRVRLAVQPPHGRQARRIDGAWWPRSYDLMSELPLLLGGLPQVWGQISSVVVNGGEWSAPPGRMLVAGHVVRVRRTDLPQAPSTACLLAPGRGRWDLLVVPPGASEAQARQLMADAVQDERRIARSPGREAPLDRTGQVAVVPAMPPCPAASGSPPGQP